jgi:hypothetical protein
LKEIKVSMWNISERIISLLNLICK